MFVNKLQIRLPRRVTAYFLLFGLAALVWLSVGAVYVAHWVSDSRSASASLRWLGRGSDRIVLSYLRDKELNLQSIVADIRVQSGASYCAIVSPAGKYTAHSNGELTGGDAVGRGGGSTDRWGDVSCVQCVGEDGRLYQEYQCPLTADGTSLGMLRLAIPRPSIGSYLWAGAQFSPLAFFGPACCMVAGAVLLNRMVRPVANIEYQLAQVAMSPSLEGCDLYEVEDVGAAAMGWNRVVQQRQNTPQSETLRQRIRQSLETGRQSHLDAVLNSIPEGVATTDAEGRLTYTNVPIVAILGLKDVITASTADDGANSDATEVPPRITDLLVQRWSLSETDALLAEENRDRPVVIELSSDENGQRRVIRVARHPICIVGSGSKHESHVWTIRDVTQQKLAEEMRDQFVDTATHELRTPLANIKAYAETLALADVIDVEQQKQFLNTINSEATRLARFVDDLLSVSSMELGSLSLNRQTTELTRMLNEVLAKIRPQIDEKKMTLEVVVPDKLPEPKLDKDKIATVLVNLLGNAIKYTPPGGRVTFRVNATDQQLEVSIADTGVGIAPEEISKVFEKFFRSDDPRVQEQTGTGLGLALSHEVVRLHGGRIEVESEINKGSTFTMLLPLT
jgi:signal transduction histidine kinase